MKNNNKRHLCFYDGSSIGDIVGSIEGDKSYGVRTYKSCSKLAENLLRFRNSHRSDVDTLIIVVHGISTEYSEYCVRLAMLDHYFKEKNS